MTRWRDAGVRMSEVPLRTPSCLLIDPSADPAKPRDSARRTVSGLRLQQQRKDVSVEWVHRVSSARILARRGCQQDGAGQRFDLKLLGDSIGCMRSLISAPEGANAWGQRPLLSWSDLGSGTAGGRDGPRAPRLDRVGVRRGYPSRWLRGVASAMARAMRGAVRSSWLLRSVRREPSVSNDWLAEHERDSTKQPDHV